MKPVGIVGTGALFLLLGTTAPGWAQDGNTQPQGNDGKQGQDDGNAKAGKPRNKGQEQKAARDEQRARHQQEKQQANQQRQAQANEQRQAQQQANQQRQAQLQAQRQQENQQRQAQANQHRAQQQVRLSQERQQQLIAQQQRRVIEYRQHLYQRQPLAQQYAARLQQQNRMANYRVQEDYLARMQAQQMALQGSYAYNDDPYFYTPSSYRYRRGGSYYETNEYGANMLRQSINNGYAEGYRAGQADRQDRWASDYKNSYAYQDANFGYSGYYVNQADYNYYFREGFNRGYQDGYNSRAQFGQDLNGSRSILGGILSQILSLQPIR
jgi:hypothetical protein